METLFTLTLRKLFVLQLLPQSMQLFEGLLTMLFRGTGPKWNGHVTLRKEWRRSSQQLSVLGGIISMQYRQELKEKERHVSNQVAD